LRGFQLNPNRFYSPVHLFIGGAIVLVWLGLAGSARAEPGQECLPSSDFQRVARYWRGSNADSLLFMAGASVQLEWGERQGTYANKAAYSVLRNFMNKHPLRTYRTLHARCEAGAGTAYLLGEYRDVNGQVFKVRIFWELQNNQWKIFRIVLR